MKRRLWRSQKNSYIIHEKRKYSMPGAKYLEKMANEKSPGVGARKRFFLE